MKLQGTRDDMMVGKNVQKQQSKILLVSSFFFFLQLRFSSSN